MTFQVAIQRSHLEYRSRHRSCRPICQKKQASPGVSSILQRLWTKLHFFWATKEIKVICFKNTITNMRLRHHTGALIAPMGLV